MPKKYKVECSAGTIDCSGSYIVNEGEKKLLEQTNECGVCGSKLIIEEIKEKESKNMTTYPKSIYRIIIEYTDNAIEIHEFDPKWEESEEMRIKRLMEISKTLGDQVPGKINIYEQFLSYLKGIKEGITTSNIESYEFERTRIENIEQEFIKLFKPQTME